jgi:transposase
MAAPRKFDEETRARAVRMVQDRMAERGESALQARRQVGAMLDINPGTLRHWIDREDVEAGTRPGVTSEVAAELKALRRENAELRRANDILKTASAFFAQAELDRRLK